MCVSEWVREREREIWPPLLFNNRLIKFMSKTICISLNKPSGDPISIRTLHPKFFSLSHHFSIFLFFCPLFSCPGYLIPTPTLSSLYSYICLNHSSISVANIAFSSFVQSSPHVFSLSHSCFCLFIQYSFFVVVVVVVVGCLLFYALSSFVVVV